MTVVSVQALMDRSGVAFGTSGARGLVSAMSDRVCYAYTRAFLQHLEASGQLTDRPRALALAGDLRPSTGRILTAVAMAARDAGYEPVHCGRIPSPAVALYGTSRRIASVMVTGSHIPDDRNGLKFNRPDGEISKEDEAGIRAQSVAVPRERFDEGDRLRAEVASTALPAISREAHAIYLGRYLGFYPAAALDGLRVGLYEHSTVARDILAELLSGLGAEVVPLGRSETFVPVDTEAIRAEDVALARRWAAETRLHALVSADGDGDRPLVADERGHWLRGDVVGILCARYLGARVVVTPVSSNTAVERSGWFQEVRRTRIGSPYVIEEMERAVLDGAQAVVGYEANGGFLVATPLEVAGRVLAALPTRDAAVVILAVLALARRRGLRVSDLLADLPRRFTASDRLKDFPTELSRARIAALHSGNAEADRQALAAAFEGRFGRAVAVDATDGLRVTFENGEIAHLRPSGNAPELRCYSEADSEERAREMNRACLALLEGWRHSR
jgi:phosphomannomutase